MTVVESACEDGSKFEEMSRGLLEDIGDVSPLISVGLFEIKGLESSSVGKFERVDTVRASEWEDKWVDGLLVFGFES